MTSTVNAFAPRGGLARISLSVFCLMIVLAMSTAPVRAQAREPGAEAFVKRVSAQLIAIMQSNEPKAVKKRKFAAVFSANADVRAIGLFALGKFRRKLPASRRGEYFSLMKRYISATFSTHMGAISGNRVEILGSENRGKKGTIVSSKLHFPGREPAPITWRLTKRGGYKVFDVRIFSIWLGPEQRTVFTGIVADNGGDVNALLKFLRDA